MLSGHIYKPVAKGKSNKQCWKKAGKLLVNLIEGSTICIKKL